jgi:hypothetical protein
MRTIRYCRLVFDITLCGSWFVLRISNRSSFVCTDSNKTGPEWRKITSAHVVEPGQQETVYAFSPHHMIFFSASSFTDRFVTPFFHHLFGLGSTWTMSSGQEARSTTRRTLKSITCGHTRQGHLPQHLLGGFTTPGRLPKGMRGYPPIPDHRSCCRLGSSRL